MIEMVDFQDPTAVLFCRPPRRETAILNSQRVESAPPKCKQRAKILSLYAPASPFEINRLAAVCGKKRMRAKFSSTLLAGIRKVFAHSKSSVPRLRAL